MKNKVLITDKVNEILPKRLKKAGYEVFYDTSYDNEKVDWVIEDFVGIIINSKIIMDKERITRGKNLKFIGRLGSGLEIIDTDFARKKRINVYNSPEGTRNAVAEHEMGMLLSLLNNIVISDSEVRNKTWDREKNRGKEIKGKTIGIIGFGHTGSEFARKLLNWGVNLVSFDKYRKRYPSEFRSISKVSLEELLNVSDIISIHLPLTKETVQMIDSNFLSKCKRGVIISNTSRGNIIDTNALLDGLESGIVSGACLDVFENEKNQNFTKDEDMMYQKLYSLPNVVLTPHIAGWTHESLNLIDEVLLDKIIRGKYV